MEESLARSAARLREAAGVSAADVIGSPDTGSGLGLACARLASLAGASLVQGGQADPLDWFRLAARRRVSVGAVRPEFLRAAAPAIRDAAGEIDLSRLRVLVVGGGPVRAEDLRAFNDAAMERSFDEVALCPCYATGPLIWSMTPPDRLWRSQVISGDDLAQGRWRTLLTDGGREVVSCGPVLPGAGVRSERPGGALLVRDGDGEWLATGDAGYANGEVFVTGAAA